MSAVLTPATEFVLRAHAVAAGERDVEPLRSALARLAVARADGDGPEHRTGICLDALGAFDAAVDAARILLDAPACHGGDVRAALGGALRVYCVQVVEILDRRNAAALRAADPRPAGESAPAPKLSADGDEALRALVAATWGNRRDLQ